MNNANDTVYHLVIFCVTIIALTLLTITGHLNIDQNLLSAVFGGILGGTANSATGNLVGNVVKQIKDNRE